MPIHHSGLKKHLSTSTTMCIPDAELMSGTISSEQVTPGIAQVVYFVTTADVSGNLSTTYIAFHSPTTTYYAWLDNGSSIDPALGGVGIHVVYANNDSATTIASKIVNAINSFDPTHAIFTPNNNVALHRVEITNTVLGVASAPGTNGTFTVSTHTAGVDPTYNRDVLIGTGTDFTLLNDDDYIYDSNSNQVVRIMANYSLPAIADNVSQRLDMEPGVLDFKAGAPLYRVKNHVAHKIILTNTGSSTAVVDGLSTFLAGEKKEYENDYGLIPMTIDGSGTTIDVEYWYT